MRYLLSLLLILGFWTGCDDSSTDPASGWHVTHANVPEALLGVWGSSANDVWIVGSDIGNGPKVIHVQGGTSKDLATESSGTLWDVWGTTAQAPVYMVGEKGLALRANRDGSFTHLSGVPASVTLKSVFVSAENSVWAAGANAEGQGKLYRLNGEQFSEVIDLYEGNEGLDEKPFVHVWGRSDQELWVLGQDSLVIERSIQGWSWSEYKDSVWLASVHGNASSTFVVGGFINGFIGELGPNGLTEVTPRGASQLHGVWIDRFGRVLAVGGRGQVFERRGTIWSQLKDVSDTINDFNDVFIADNEEVWIVGGYLQGLTPKDGILVHYQP